MRVIALVGCASGALLSEGGVNEGRQGSGRRTGSKQTDAAPRTGGKGSYTALVENFDRMKGLAEGERTTEQGNFDVENTSCATKKGTREDNIDGFQEAQKTAQEAADAAQKKYEALDAKLVKDNKLNDDLKAQKAQGITTWGTSRARMMGDMANLSGAATAITTLMADKDGKFFGGLGGNARTRMEATIGNLEQRVKTERENLKAEINSGLTAFNNNIMALQNSIISMGAGIASDVMTRGVEFTAYETQTAAAGTAKTNLDTEQGLLQSEQATCAQTMDTIQEAIDDAGERVMALTKAISILGASAAAPELEEKRTTTIAGAGVALLETSFLAKPGSKQKLAAAVQMLEKSNSRAAAILKAALSVSPAQQDAFQKIIAEIHTMFDQMDEEDKEDVKAQTECQQMEDKLESDKVAQIDDRDKLQAEHDAIVGAQKVLQGKIDDAKTEYSTAQGDMVHNTKLIQKDITDNNEERKVLKIDLGNLKQAEIVLGNEFRDRHDETSKVIMKLITNLIEEYEAGIKHSKREHGSLNREQEQNEDNGKTAMRQQDRMHKRLQGDHEAKDNRKTAVETDRRDVKAELRATETAIRKIFTNDDGRCHKYDEVYPSRVEKREGERAQLKGAKVSLKEYMVSIGVRVN